MDITAEQARYLIEFTKNNKLSKKVREELDDIFALIERACKKGYGNIATKTISEGTINYLINYGYEVYNDKKEQLIYIIWSK